MAEAMAMIAGVQAAYADMGPRNAIAEGHRIELEAEMDQAFLAMDLAALRLAVARWFGIVGLELQVYVVPALTTWEQHWIEGRVENWPADARDDVPAAAATAAQSTDVQADETANLSTPAKQTDLYPSGQPAIT